MCQLTVFMADAQNSTKSAFISTESVDYAVVDPGFPVGGAWTS